MHKPGKWKPFKSKGSLWFLCASCILNFGCKTPSILVTEEQRMGDFYNNSQDYEQAIVHYKNALTASSKLGTYRNLTMEADVCRKMAHAYTIRGEFLEALDYLGLALQKDSLQNNSIEVIEDIRELGKTYLYLGNYEQGMERLKQALQLSEELEFSLKGINQHSLADTYLSLSQLHMVLGDFIAGEAYARDALNLYRNLNYPEGKAESLLLLGKIYIQKGQGDLAETYVKSSLDLAMDLELNIYRHKQALARLNENRAQYEEALRWKLEALEDARNSKNRPQVVWANMLVGDLYMVLGDKHLAMEYYQESNRILDSMHVLPMALDASANLRTGNIDLAYNYYSASASQVAAGIAALRMGEVAMEWELWAEAQVHFHEALNRFTATGLFDVMGRSLILLAMANMELNNFHLAEEYLDRADSLVIYDETKWKLAFARGNLYEDLSIPDKAIEAYRMAVEVIERIRGNFKLEEYKSIYLENKMEVYNSLIRLLMEVGRPEESFYYSERARARAFLDMLSSGQINFRQDESSELLQIEQTLRQEIQSLHLLMQKNDMFQSRGFNRNQLQKKIVDLREEYVDVLQKIKLYNREYSSMVNLEILKFENLQKDLESDAAYLCYWIDTKHMYVWMLSTDGMVSKTMNVGEEESIQLVSMARQIMRSNKDYGVLFKLYDILVRPFEEALEPYETVCIVPHLALHFLPFQCLMPDSSSYFIDRHNLCYTPSMNVYSLNRKKELKPQHGLFALALGNLELGGLPGLPGTTQEVNAIATFFSEPTLNFEQSSTESFFKNKVKSYEYVHLATHGIFDQQQPIYSHVMLAPSEKDDGLLSVGEIFGLEMNASLVVLSACQTGLGIVNNGDEIVGLSRAFLYAGSKSVIVSLWNVADKPTSYLMTQFYKNLENYHPAQSLRHAQIATRQRYSLPVHWAPFQLIGSEF